MKIAQRNDKGKVVKILYNSFVDIKVPTSINFVVGLEKGREKRLKALMEYQFDKALLNGKVFISDDDKAVILFVEHNIFHFRNIILDIQLLFNCIGIKNVFKVIKREKILKRYHLKQNFVHLWLMGVEPVYQGKGIGAKLIDESFKFYPNKIIYVETTTFINLEFYRKNGFIIFEENHELDYPLYFLKSK